MAAVGLIPDFRIDELNEAMYMTTLTEYVFGMKDRLIAINENSYNNFMLRVGMSIGPVGK